MTDTNPTAASLEQELDRDYPPAWRPKPGEKLVGTVVRVDELIARYEDKETPYPCVTIRPDDGVEMAFHGFHTVAKSQIAAQRPKPGDRIGIKYQGLINGKYHGYRVVIDRPQPVDWDRLQADAEAEAAGAGIAADDDVPF